MRRRQLKFAKLARLHTVVSLVNNDQSWCFTPLFPSNEFIPIDCDFIFIFLWSSFGVWNPQNQLYMYVRGSCVWTYVWHVRTILGILLYLAGCWTIKSIQGSDKLALLFEQWISCSGHWNQSSFLVELRQSSRNRKRGARRWMTVHELRLKYGLTGCRRCHSTGQGGRWAVAKNASKVSPWRSRSVRA